MNEQIIETKKCKSCEIEYNITDKDKDFYNRISPKFDGQKFEIPFPTLCPDCRQQRRLSWRNERNLYKRPCDATGKSIISVYSAEKPYKVFEQNEWWSDKWNPMGYGIDFDFNKTFFEQFEELMKKVPRVSIINKNSINSEYTNISAHNKNCYLIVESSNNEDCLYGYWLQKGQDNVDCSFLNFSENCYETIDSNHCNKVFFSQNCNNCAESYFLKNCNGCSFCIGCTNLTDKKYYAFNQEIGKEKYNEFTENIKKHPESVLQLKEKFDELKIKSINKYAQIFNSDNCFGDYIFDAQNCENSYEIHDAKEGKHCVHLWFNSHSCYDVDTVGYNCSFNYESMNTALDSVNNKFCCRCWTVSNSMYCNDCDNSTNLFGCIGLRNKEYCILNKQYSKEEYEKSLAKILAHMQTTGERGEFFPSSLSPFAYNETVANEYFPMSKEEITSKGLKRKEEEDKNYSGPVYINKSISEYDETKVGEIAKQNKDELLGSILKCEISGRPYKIIKQELDFYIKHSLIIPNKHPDIRHEERIRLRNPRKLFNRNCDNCNTDIKTTYTPEKQEIVYCEKCYNEEVY